MDKALMKGKVVERILNINQHIWEMIVKKDIGTEFLYRGTADNIDQIRGSNFTRVNIIGVPIHSNLKPFIHNQTNKITTENILAEEVPSYIEPIICECGSDKVNSGIHSVWCPKYV